jgi:hypothetical protein
MVNFKVKKYKVITHPFFRTKPGKIIPIDIGRRSKTRMMITAFVCLSYRKKFITTTLFLCRLLYYNLQKNRLKIQTIFSLRAEISWRD